jgi:hypothetical protein
VAEELERREALKRAEEEERERQREAARAAAMAREEELRKLTSQWAQEPKEEGALVWLGFGFWGVWLGVLGWLVGCCAGGVVLM